MDLVHDVWASPVTAYIGQVPIIPFPIIEPHSLV
jgi:hypothetical protein